MAAKITCHTILFGKLYYWVQDGPKLTLARHQALPEGVEVEIVEVFERADAQWQWQRKQLPSKHVLFQSGETFTTQKKAVADAKLVKHENKGLPIYVLGQAEAVRP